MFCKKVYFQAKSIVVEVIDGVRNGHFFLDKSLYFDSKWGKNCDSQVERVLFLVPIYAKIHGLKVQKCTQHGVKCEK